MSFFKKVRQFTENATKASLGDPKTQEKQLGDLAPTKVGVGKDYLGEEFEREVEQMSKEPHKNIGRHTWKPPQPNPVKPEVVSQPSAGAARVNYISPENSTYITLNDLQQRVGQRGGGRVDPFAPKSYNKTRQQLAVGGEIDMFVALSDEVERLASMQSSEEGGLLRGGVMSMETLSRKASRREFKKGGAYVGPPKFEKRISRPDPKMFIEDPKSGNPQTHRMAWGDIEGQFIAYPTIVEEDGKLVQYKNNHETMKLMKKTGNFKAFDTPEEAEAYADGTWKTKEFHETYRKKLEHGGPSQDGRVLKALKALAKEGTFNFEPEKGAEILDEETELGTGEYKPDYLANKGEGKAKFVQMVYENAVALGLKHPEWIASQAGAESRYGASDLAQGSNNILGIKLRANEEGPSKMYPTKEQQTTGLEPEMANFREFGSIDESLQGYDTFLRTGINKEGLPRYDKALAAPTGPQYIQELKNAGYASDDSYVKLITDVHNQYFPSE